MESQGTSISQFRSSQGGSFGKSEFSQEEVSDISNKLHKKLGKDHTASRVGAGNSRFTYIESWKVIQLANQIFSFNGWSCSIVDISPDYIEESKGRFSVGATAVVRITLRDGTTHEDVGFGMSENPKKGSAIELAKKEAVSDARKRALRLFGDSLGNCLYDKNHLKRIKLKDGSMGDDILDSQGSSMPLPMMSIKNEVKEEDDQSYGDNYNGAPPAANNAPPPPVNCAFNKPQPTMNNNNSRGPVAQKFQPYPKMPPNAMLNTPSANSNPYLNNNNAMKPPMANNGIPMRTGIVAQKPNLPPAPLTKSFTAPLNNNNNIISPSPIIGGQDEEEENYDFNALDNAENLRSSSAALPPPVSSASF